MSTLFCYLNKRENRKQNEKKLALVYKFCHCTLKLFLQLLPETIFCRKCNEILCTQMFNVEKCQANVPSTSI